MRSRNKVTQRELGVEQKYFFAIVPTFPTFHYLFSTTLLNYISCTSLFFTPFLTVYEYIRESYIIVTSSQLVATLMVLIIISETLLFGAFFWAALSTELSTIQPTNSIYTLGITSPSSTSLLTSITFLLASASVFGSTAYILNRLSISRTAGLILFIYITAFTFSTLQASEFLLMEFYMNDSYGFIFLSLTGLHFFHVQIGIILLFTYTPVQQVDPIVFTPIHKEFQPFGTSILSYPPQGFLCLIYWHFVELIWIFLSILLYY